MSKEGGTGESLKLELHLNSEVYKREFLTILVWKREKNFELHLKKTRSAVPADALYVEAPTENSPLASNS